MGPPWVQDSCCLLLAESPTPNPSTSTAIWIELVTSPGGSPQGMARWNQLPAGDLSSSSRVPVLMLSQYLVAHCPQS